MQRLLALLTALLPVLAAAAAPTAAHAQETPLALTEITDWKAVYGRVEARDRIPARARIGGTLTELLVTEGDRVEAGQPLARVVDQKLVFQIGALDAQLQALESQLGNAESELRRGEELLSRGVTTAQRLDALRTQVEVLKNQIEAAKSQRQVVEQQAAEGEVLAPTAGIVLNVPVTKGAVLMPGEAVAEIGGGGLFLRLAIPERHAAFLRQGDAIDIETASGSMTGTLAKVYPLIENGRVLADVEVAGLPENFVDARVLVRLPIDRRKALMVPQDMVVTHDGLDFVAIRGADGAPVLRTVILGARHEIGGVPMIEVVTGLSAGDVVVPAHE